AQDDDRDPLQTHHLVEDPVRGGEEQRPSEVDDRDRFVSRPRIRSGGQVLDAHSGGRRELAQSEERGHDDTDAHGHDEGEGHGDEGGDDEAVGVRFRRPQDRTHRGHADNPHRGDEEDTAEGGERDPTDRGRGDEDDEQQHEGVDDGGQAGAPAGADVDRGAGYGTGGGDAAEERGPDRRDALADQLPVRLVGP